VPDARAPEPDLVGTDGLPPDDRFATGVGDLRVEPHPILDALLSVLPDPVFRLSRDGSVLGMWAGPGNRMPEPGVAYFRALSERSDLTVDDLVPPDLAERLMKIVEEVLDTGDIRVLEYGHDVLGAPRQLQGRCARCGPDEVVWLVEDVTTEIEARQQLEAHEARYHAVVETLDEAIVLHDRHGHSYASNRAAIALFGDLDRPSEALKSFVGDDITPVDAEGRPRARKDNPVQATLRTGESQLGKVIGFARTGHPTRWLRVTTRLLEMGVDRPVSVVSTSVDITAERNAEEAAASRIAYDVLLSNSAARLLGASADELDDVVVSCLGDLARFLDADVAFVGEFCVPGVLELRHDWRSPAAGPRREASGRTRRATFPVAGRLIDERPCLLVRSMDDLPPGATYERAMMERLGDKSFGWVMVGPSERPAGLIGLAWKRESYHGAEEPVEQLVRVGEAMLAALARRRAQRLSAGQREVLELIATGAPLGEALEAVARLREGGDETLRSAVFLVDSSGAALTLAAAPRLDEASRQRLDNHSVDDDSPIAEAVRTCRPASIGQADGSDSFVDFTEALAQVGVHTMSAVPVVSSQSGKAVGAIATFDRDPDPVGLVDGELDQACAALAEVAIERATDVAELSHQATHDPLTGAANRVALLDRLEQALVRARAHGTLVAVLFCDLDHFKDVNDRFGHQHGDRLLQEVASRIAAVVDPTDTVSRFGGDEFVVLCDDLRGEQHALEVADRVARAVEGSPIAIADDLVHITTSIGVAFSTPSADHPEALVRDADVAMYRAKASGRARREVFHESIRRAARDRDELAQELAVAIHEHQLDLYYQPLVSLGSGGVEGLEALVRWPHPTRGLLGPGNFIPVAEETGLIVALGRWVADEALRQLAEWSAADPRWERLLMHVNVSARQLSEPGYVDEVRGSIERWGVDPGRVMLELTESILMADSPLSRDAIKSLHDSGARLVLDDFGTGYASLTYLRRFPLQGIKVDRSFVAGLGHRSEDEAIVRAVVQLGRSLGLDVVAEGVETAEQEGLLRGLGCDSAQGFHFARPVPARDVLPILDRLSG
jgi:diguanylate cyclase (GGDEF)-like protein/PAS domain S-box-containing protein